MIAVKVVGRSDAGKTTLIERLVPALDDRGRVATIKSIHHDVEFDQEGKDTHRHRVAGAERVIGVTPSLTMSIETRGKDDYPSESDALARLSEDLSREGYEYALVEGFSSARLPTIAVGDCETDGAPLAHVSDPGAVDVEGLADRIDRLDPWDGET